MQRNIKTADLVIESFQNVKGSLEDIRLLHRPQKWIQKQTIKELLERFDIKRSLSHKGCSYDNTVAKATSKIIKTEFL